MQVLMNNDDNNNALGHVFLSKLGRKLAAQSGDDREIRLQWLSILIQRYNAILLHDGEGEVRFIPAWFLYFFVLHSVIFSFPGN